MILAATATLALAGCGAAATPSDAGAWAESVALEEVGFTTDASPSAAPHDGVRPRVVRKLLRRDALHGEVTVQAKDGVRIVVVQRGKITAVDGTSLTVRSTDGFELTWSYGDPLRIVRERKVVDRAALTTGVEVGIGGVRSGSATSARLIRLAK
ncbi:hypothetical protein Asi03nite_12030 [Actinoplanes siamensis]|uniref:DUF5666 domain-containing protein n=2 Tax=Actinoplanes siamensis TaxID=1223317 RepID=A0A919N3E9_9ACTN|nr:hypothetical protein Asi03nite_12030 [Actinoplanes siamensis]